MMNKLFWLLALPLISACTLTSARGNEALLPTVTPVVIEPVVQEITPLPTEEIPDVDTPIVAQPQPVVTCSARVDWLPYAVVAGDTLFSLAQRTNSSVDALAQGNCLEDANTISVGQTIRVPRAPLAQLPPVTAGCTGLDGWSNVGINALVISPNSSFNGTCYGVQGGITLTISWPGAPASVTEVEFLRRSPAMSKSDIMGVDSDPSDGFSIQTEFYPGMPPSVIYAFGYNPAVSGSQRDSGTVGVFIAP